MLARIKVEFCDKLFVLVFKVLSYLLLSCKSVQHSLHFTSTGRYSPTYSNYVGTFGDFSGLHPSVCLSVCLSVLQRAAVKALTPVHTGDYVESSNLATVAVFGDKLSPISATIFCTTHIHSVRLKSNMSRTSNSLNLT